MEIILENLTKAYQDADRKLVVIENLSVRFKSAEHLAIMGRSGVGKSTLLHLLGGLDLPTSGKLKIGQHELNQLNLDTRSDFRGTNIGFIFQFHHLLPDFTALENVAMPLYIQGVAEMEAQERARDILTRTGLAERLQHRPSELSGGEQQRVAVARALVHKPAVVLADEPTGSLDEATGKIVHDLLRQICREHSSTLIVVTHNSELAAGFDRMYEMTGRGQLTEVIN